MKSDVLSSFWACYQSLEELIQVRAKKAYRMWTDNPYHPFLHFKCVDSSEDVWSVRISRGYRALGVLDGDTVTWFWIGGHVEYERFLS